MAKYRRLCLFTFVGSGLLAATLFVPASWHGALATLPARQTSTAVAPSAASQAQAQRVALAGVPNFGRVTPNLYRGAQPTDAGFQELKKLGVEIVVNFRNKRGQIEAERRTVERLRLGYRSIPWVASHSPTSEQVADFLELLRANPQSKVFIHCHKGADRTGVMVAAYRIVEQRWTPPQAVQEMRAYHYHHFWWPNLQRYVEDFPRLLDTDPKLRAFAPLPHVSAP